jgi:hypothetical protein
VGSLRTPGVAPRARRVLALALAGLLIPGGSAFADAGPGPTATALSPTGGLLVNGVPTFPIGLSPGPSHAPGMRQVAGDGVDMFRYNPPVPWADPSALAAVHTFDAQVASVGGFSIVNLCGTCGQPRLGVVKPELLSTIIQGLRNDPGFGIYKGPDEPYWNGIRASAIRPVYTAGKTQDPDHVWALVQSFAGGSAAAFAPYASATDVQAVDVYPIQAGGNAPLDSVGLWTARTAAATPNHAVWTTLQLCTAAAGGRIPTRAQLRFMAWDAVINGARGINLFGGNMPSCWRGTDSEFGWAWTAFDRLAPTLRQMRGMNDVLVSPSAALPRRGSWEGAEFQAGTLGTWRVRANVRTLQVAISRT